MTEIDIEALAEKLAERMADGTFARPLLSVKGLAERLDISERTATNLIREPDPEIPSFMVGGLRKIDPREVDRYVERQKARTDA